MRACRAGYAAFGGGLLCTDLFPLFTLISFSLLQDMKHGPGSAQGAEGGSDRPSADSPAVAAAAEEGSLKEGWPAAAKGGTGGSATASAGGGAGAAQGLPDQPQAEGSLKEGGVAVTDQLAVQAAEEAREEEAGGGGKEAGGRGQQEEDPNTSARRSAMDMVGGLRRGCWLQAVRRLGFS